MFFGNRFGDFLNRLTACRALRFGFFLRLNFRHFFFSQIARHAVRGRYLNKRRILAFTALFTLLATVFKIAVFGHIDRVRHLTFYAVQPIRILVDNGLAFLKSYRIRVQRHIENVLDSAFFYYASRIHNDNVIRHASNNAQIVRNKHDRPVDFVFDFFEQVQNLGLYCHVERGGRLVRYYQFGIASERHGNHNALTHTARQLVRIAFVNNVGHSYADKPQHFERALFCKRFIRPRGVEQNDFVQLIAYREQRIKAGHRLLEDHCDFLAANTPHRICRHFCNVENFIFELERGKTVAVQRLNVFHYGFAVFIKYGIALFIEHGFGLDNALAVYFLILPNGNRLAVFVGLIVLRVKPNRSVDYLSLRSLNKLHDGQRRYRFSATALADNADDRTFWNIERHAVYCLGHARIGKEIRAKIVYFQNIRRVAHLGNVFAFARFAQFFLFVHARRLAIFARYSARFLARNIMRIVFMREVSVPSLYTRDYRFFFCHATPTSSSSGRARRAIRRR